MALQTLRYRERSVGKRIHPIDPNTECTLILTSQDGHVRRVCERGMRGRIGESDAARRKTIEYGRPRTRIAVRSEAVSTKRIDGNQQHVPADWPGLRWDRWRVECHDAECSGSDRQQASSCQRRSDSPAFKLSVIGIHPVGFHVQFTNTDAIF